MVRQDAYAKEHFMCNGETQVACNKMALFDGTGLECTDP